MNVSRKLRPLAAVQCSGSLFAARSAHTLVDPPIQMTQGIEYMSSGLGSDDAQWLATVSPHWPANTDVAASRRSTTQAPT